MPGLFSPDKLPKPGMEEATGRFAGHLAYAFEAAGFGLVLLCYSEDKRLRLFGGFMMFVAVVLLADAFTDQVDPSPKLRVG